MRTDRQRGNTVSPSVRFPFLSQGVCLGENMQLTESVVEPRECQLLLLLWLLLFNTSGRAVLCGRSGCSSYDGGLDLFSRARDS